MVSIVVVSHSRALARAAVELALEMVDEARRPRVEVAAGLDEASFGTDAMAISEAVLACDSDSGTVVLLDLGSAILSTEMALEFVAEDVASRVRISPAPLVEGLVAAVVSAAGGADVDQVETEARRGLDAKREQLGAERDPLGDEAEADTEADGGPGAAWQPPVAEFRTRLTLAHGLHARPAAALVQTLAGLEVTMQLQGEQGWVDGHSITAVQRLGLRQGDELVARFAGPDAHQAHERLAALTASGFGETPQCPAPAVEPGQAVGAPPTEAPRHRLPMGAFPADAAVDTAADFSDPAAGRLPEQEAQALRDAMERCQQFLRHLGSAEPDNQVQAKVLGAMQAILSDPSLTRDVRRRLKDGHSALQAVAGATTTVAAQFKKLPNPYLRERATDLRALGALATRALLGQPLELPATPRGHVLVVDELDAITAAQLSPDEVAGIEVLAAGDLGHGLEVARSRGIPVLVRPR